MLRADPSVVRPLHVQVMRIVGRAETEYGPLDLRLEGGTALAAYHLRHRESEDLDFFGAVTMDARDFATVVGRRLEEEGFAVRPVGPTNQGFARLLVAVPAGAPDAPILLDFGRGSPFHLESAERTEEGIRVASYRDLCAGKLHAICDRFEPRDFVDLHAILHHPYPGVGASDGDPLRARANRLIRDVMEIDPGLTPSLIGQALQRGASTGLLSEFPLRLLVQMTEEEIRRSIQLTIDECVRLVREGVGW
jgi:hypothetical protein